MIRFGPGGNSEKFHDDGYKSSVDMPKWLSEKGLSAYEYQCNKGIKIGEKTARELGKNAKENDVLLSIHAPYYINMASVEERIKQGSIRYLIESLQAASYMGADRVVFHPGALGKMSRKEALGKSIDLFKVAIGEADSKNLLEKTYICPELMGKMNQVGSLEEIMELCKIDERILPAIDFGHLNARMQGGLIEEEDFLKVFDIIENNLGIDRLSKMHVHFSRIEFTKGGEKKHWNFEDIQHGPDFFNFAKAVIKKKIYPVVICESMSNMMEDAMYMKETYQKLLELA